MQSFHHLWRGLQEGSGLPGKERTWRGVLPSAGAVAWGTASRFIALKDGQSGISRSLGRSGPRTTLLPSDQSRWWPLSVLWPSQAHERLLVKQRWWGPSFFLVARERGCILVCRCLSHAQICSSSWQSAKTVYGYGEYFPFHRWKALEPRQLKFP